MPVRHARPGTPTVAALLTLVLTAALLVSARPATAQPPVERLDAVDRIAAAVAVARTAFPAPTQAVVLARADDFPDALSGAALAAVEGAPILVTPTEGLDPRVAELITDLGARRAVLLGGTAALSSQVEADLTTLGLPDIERLAGPDRFATSRVIAERVVAATGQTGAFLALGSHPEGSRAWADAVAVSALSASAVRPVVLTGYEGLTTDTTAVLDGLDRVTLVGGTAAISQSIEADVQALGVATDRLAGSNRFLTSLAVAQQHLDEGASLDRVWLASTANFSDPLVTGPAAAATGSVMLLVDADNWDTQPARDYLQANDEQVGAVTLVGDQTVFPSEVANDIGLPTVPDTDLGPGGPVREHEDAALSYRDQASGDLVPLDGAALAGETTLGVVGNDIARVRFYADRGPTRPADMNDKSEPFDFPLAASRGAFAPGTHYLLAHVVFTDFTTVLLRADFTVAELSIPRAREVRRPRPPADPAPKATIEPVPAPRAPPTVQPVPGPPTLPPADAYVRESATGRGDGSSWADALGWRALGQLMADPAVTVIYLAAEEYDVPWDAPKVVLSGGGTASAPKQIYAVDPATDQRVMLDDPGHDHTFGRGAVFVSGRAQDPRSGQEFVDTLGFSRTGLPGGGLAFILDDLAHVDWYDLGGRDIRQLFQVEGPVRSVRFFDPRARNVERWLDTAGSISGPPDPDAHLRDVELIRPDMRGLHRGAIRIRNQSVGVSIIDPQFDCQYTMGSQGKNPVAVNVADSDDGEKAPGDPGDLPAGPDQTTVAGRDSRGKLLRCGLDKGDSYWQGDGIVSERHTRGTRVTDVLLGGHFDGGVDLKGDETVMERVVADTNKRNIRLWGSGQLRDIISLHPTKAAGVGDPGALPGGTGSVDHLWHGSSGAELQVYGLRARDEREEGSKRGNATVVRVSGRFDTAAVRVHSGDVRIDPDNNVEGSSDGGGTQNIRFDDEVDIDRQAVPERQPPTPTGLRVAAAPWSTSRVEWDPSPFDPDVGQAWWYDVDLGSRVVYGVMRESFDVFADVHGDVDSIRVRAVNPTGASGWSAALSLGTEPLG